MKIFVIKLMTGSLHLTDISMANRWPLADCAPRTVKPYSASFGSGWYKYRKCVWHYSTMAYNLTWLSAMHLALFRSWCMCVISVFVSVYKLYDDIEAMRNSRPSCISLCSTNEASQYSHSVFISCDISEIWPRKCSSIPICVMLVSLLPF